MHVKNCLERTLMRITVMAIWTLTSVAAYSQINIGIKGGLNICDVVMNDVNDQDAENDFDLKLGFHSGLFASIDLDDAWGASAELLYSGKGVSAAGNRINLHYIVLPLLAQYSIGQNLKTEGGIELGYLIVADSKYGTAYSWNNKLDLGLDLGVQLAVMKNAHLGLRFNAGILSVIQPANGTSGLSGAKYQNRVLSLTFAYRLGRFEP